ncbi:restriction endonuclease subunit S [Limosilactobacillus reuteri]|uniref:restriction endonuclease subunit S n=3 Tax=Limosilactobacillus reuteri TaxID=1598 RepID=UPI0021A7FB2F|nr:restriction endonuclease subunit S [Limosilactobacillus reuteri]MCT3202061.1 restriction endonuclease subunit S [Limosilactobacillus reuteri]
MDKKPEKLVPEVRFKGFTDDWEQRKFDNVVKRINDKDDNPELPHIEFENIISGNGTLNKNIKDLNSKKIGTKFQKEDILFGKLRPYLKNWYFAKENGIAVGDFWVLRAKKISVFVYYLIQTEKFYSIANLSSGSKMPRSDWNLVSNSRFNFPENTIESIKIGNLILQLDKLITLQQRKLEQLKLLEKAHQQKLFPNSFQEKPLLRILHGDNSWWNSYIGEVFTERVDKGSSEKLLSVSITDGVYPFDESKRKNNSSDDKHNYKKVFQNDIAYNSMRLWQGALGVSKYEGIVSPAYTVLKPLPNQNSIFYEFMFKNIDMLHIFQRNSQGLTSDTWNLKFNQLQHIKIKTTNLNSQNKIAKLLIKIEELKNNESNYYHNLMTLKKYLLQKLFL